MRERLRMTADAKLPAAKVILQTAVHALNRRPHFVALLLNLTQRCLVAIGLRMWSDDRYFAPKSAASVPPAAPSESCLPSRRGRGDLDAPGRQRPTPRPRQTMGDHLSSRIALLDGGKPKTHRCGASRHFIDDSALLLP